MCTDLVQPIYRLSLRLNKAMGEKYVITTNVIHIHSKNVKCQIFCLLIHFLLKLVEGAVFVTSVQLIAYGLEGSAFESG
jgi:hypothetical protein